MKWSLRNLFFPGVGLILIVAGVVLINQNATIEYPLTTWRMDLDDALIGFGTILLGAAAIWTVWLKQKALDQEIRKVDNKLNGGLSSIASQVMRDELKQAGIDKGLTVRVEFLEDQYQECLMREMRWEKERAYIHANRKMLRQVMEDRNREDSDLAAIRIDEDEERRDEQSGDTREQP